MFFKKYYKSILILTLALIPTTMVSAAQLVPCGGPADACTLCDLYSLTQNIINFLMWGIAPVLAVLVIAWGGFNILIAGGEPAKKQTGYNAIKAVIIGLLIVFGAWIVVNEFLLFFTGQTTGTAEMFSGTVFSNPWTEIRCQ